MKLKKMCNLDLNQNFPIKKSLSKNMKRKGKTRKGQSICSHIFHDKIVFRIYKNHSLNIKKINNFYSLHI